MTSINAYLTFNGNCHEAMTFYKECLGGELIIQTVAGSPMESHWPKEAQNKVLHSTLKNGNLVLLGSDMAEPQELSMGNNISLSLFCSSNEEIQLFFNKLSIDGKIKYPLHDFYDGKIGGIIDKFGINWMLKL
jgi:PhnB protein